MSRIKSSISVAMMGGMLVSLLACSESNRNTAPVELVATATEKATTIDVLAPPDPADVAEILVRAFRKNTTSDVPSDPRFLDVLLKSYRVSYVRTDGGKTVPASFVVGSDQLLTVGGTPVPLNVFIAFEPGALGNAPFAALLPTNGGIDPETGRRVIDMDVRVEIFGETLSGQNVFTTARFPITVCSGCTG
jgi:hypothetical protein